MPRVTDRPKRKYTIRQPTKTVRTTNGKGPLFEVRQALGMAQNEFSTLIGISAPARSNYELDGKFPERLGYRQWRAVRKATLEALEKLSQSGIQMLGRSIIETTAREVGFLDED